MRASRHLFLSPHALRCLRCRCLTLISRFLRALHPSESRVLTLSYFAPLDKFNTEKPMRRIGFVTSCKPSPALGRVQAGVVPILLAESELPRALVDSEVQEQLAEVVVEAVALLGGLTIVIAVALTAINFVFTIINAFNEKGLIDQFMPFDFDIGAGPATITRIRLQLAQMLALGLEILLIGDVLETLTQSTQDYSFESLYKLALVGAIRTFLSYFLGLETEEFSTAPRSTAASTAGTQLSAEETEKRGSVVPRARRGGDAHLLKRPADERSRTSTMAPVPHLLLIASYVAWCADYDRGER